MADGDARAKKANAARRRELRAWKEENGVDRDTKVFVMDAPAKNKQGDLAVRDYLEALGWHYNEAVEPPESLMLDISNRGFPNFWVRKISRKIRNFGTVQSLDFLNISRQCT